MSRVYRSTAGPFFEDARYTEYGQMQDRQWECDRTTKQYWSIGTFDPKLPVAAFDFDGTLAPYRGRGTAAALTMSFLVLIARSHNLVIFSNRSSYATKNSEPVERYVDALDELMEDTLAAMPDKNPVRPRISAYMACTHNRFRKPLTGMWDAWRERMSAGEKLRPGSFYCGDAAGRPGDFSDSDHRFALNLRMQGVDIRFVVPEVFFGAASWDDVLPIPPRIMLPADKQSVERRKRSMACLMDLAQQNPLTCVIMVGSPASGKSAIARILCDQLQFELVSNDVPATRTNRHFRGLVERGKNIVIDNTNPTARNRTQYFIWNVEYVRIICHVTTPREICEHLNSARMQEGRPGVPPIAIATYWSRFEPIEPDDAMNDTMVIEIPFALSTVATDTVKFGYF